MKNKENYNLDLALSCNNLFVSLKNKIEYQNIMGDFTVAWGLISVSDTNQM